MSTRANTAVFLCNVAGVTFENPDGENRQEIIKNLIDTNGTKGYWTGPGKLNVVRYINEEEGRDEPAIEIRIMDKLIGYVPKNLVEKIGSHQKTQSGSVIVQLSYSPHYDVYSAKIFAPNRTKPTPKMVYAVNKILKEKPDLEAPEETFDAYRAFLNEHQGNTIKQTKMQLKQL